MEKAHFLIMGQSLARCPGGYPGLYSLVGETDSRLILSVPFGECSDRDMHRRLGALAMSPAQGALRKRHSGNKKKKEGVG